MRNLTGEVVGVLVREQQPVEGDLEISAEQLKDDLHKVTVRIFNLSILEDAEHKNRDEALMRSLVSTHTLLGVREGEFVSLMDPPERYQKFATECRNVGSWPVLVGEEGQKNAMLSAPIILYDYPQVAEESAGDLFDSTEIDEILTLRVLTLTDEEKREASSLDEQTRLLMERTQALGRDQLAKLHGTIRDLRPFEEGD